VWRSQVRRAGSTDAAARCSHWAARRKHSKMDFIAPSVSSRAERAQACSRLCMRDFSMADSNRRLYRRTARSGGPGVDPAMNKAPSKLDVASQSVIAVWPRERTPC
jgi:hypothetical protein